MSSELEAGERRQFLSFRISGESFAIGILKVKEILQYENITRVPSTPGSVRGVINLRGAVIPVMDLAVKFGLGATPLTKWSCILVVETELEGERAVVGVMADSVSEVMELGPAIEAPPAFGAGVRVEYLVGMGKVGKGFVLLLDIDRVLGSSDREAASGLARIESAA